MNQLKQLLLDILIIINVLQDTDESLPDSIDRVWIKNLILELEELLNHLKK